MKKLILPVLIAFLVATMAVFGTGSEEQKPAAPVEDNRLVIYTYDSFPEALEESIRARFPETEVVLERFVDAGGLFTQVLLEKDTIKADVVIGLDTTYLPRAFAEGIFQPYRPPSLPLVSDDLLVDPEYRVVPFDYGSVVLNYDSSVLTNPPESWQDLTNAEYKNQIILLNPATSSPGRNFLLFTVAEFGEEGYLDYWETLKPNILTIASGWSEGYGLYTQGEAAIVLSYDTSPAYHKEYEAESKYRNLLFSGKGYVQIEVAGILSGAPHFSAAAQCIDHILSVEFQELIPLNQFMYPVHAEAVLPDSFSWAGPADNLIRLDPKLVDAKFDIWLERWEAVMR